MSATSIQGIDRPTLGGIVHDTDALDRSPMTISDAFLATALKAYRENAKYLKSAKITHFDENAAPPDAAQNANLMTVTGQFSIPECCHYDSSGHFCAVEFNICYGQLACVVFGKCVEAGLLRRHIPFLANHDRHEPPSIAIARMEGVRFLRQLRNDDFHAEFTITKMCFEGPVCFLFTSIVFSDREGLKAKGSVVLTLSPASGVMED